MDIHRYKNIALLTAGLVASLALSPVVLRGDDHDRKEEGRKYHDKAHNDDHQWSEHEDQAYRMWAKEKHRKEGDFARLNDHDQQAYWGWRNSHSDSLLKIEIR